MERSEGDFKTRNVRFDANFRALIARQFERARAIAIKVIALVRDEKRRGRQKNYSEVPWE